MAYTKENKLRRILDIQECFKKHYVPGMTIEYIYNNHIFPTFKISRSDFYKKMKVDAKAELKNIENAKNSTPAQQLSMDIFLPSDENSI